jgi:hypothetical protein
MTMAGAGATGAGLTAAGTGAGYGLAGAGAATGEGLTAGAGATMGGGAAESGGLLAGAGKYAGAANTAMQTANNAKQLSQPDMQAPVAQMPQPTQGPDVSGLLAAQSQEDQMISAEQLAKRQQQQQWLQGLLGGSYGRSA